MYFSEFPEIIYQSNGVKYLVKDILIGLETNVRDSKTLLLYDQYNVKDGERPDSVANRFYKHPKYHFVVLLVNDMTPEEWPLSENQLNRLILEKYGTKADDIFFYEENGIPNNRVTFSNFLDENGNLINFYEDGSGLGASQSNAIVSRGTPVTFREYETRINDEKRIIDVLQQRFLSDFVNEFRSKVKAVL